MNTRSLRDDRLGNDENDLQVLHVEDWEDDTLLPERELTREDPTARHTRGGVRLEGAAASVSPSAAERDDDRSVARSTVS
jgi:hypothetical protein